MTTSWPRSWNVFRLAVGVLLQLVEVDQVELVAVGVARAEQAHGPVDVA